MLRSKYKQGWWLVTHPDHAHLAGEFASKWGNDFFSSPEPRKNVLRGISSHDDGWRARDAEPFISSNGKPAAFSSDLVGKYAAFEEIDLGAYLAVRREAVQLMAEEDPYAAILISMHTHNLLSEHADRATIRAEDLMLLDAFLAEQMTLQRDFRERLASEGQVDPKHLDLQVLQKHFQLLQACDNLSLLSCVDFEGEATLLHPFDMTGGDTTEIAVTRVGARAFRLTPYPFAESNLTFTFPARYVDAETFTNSDELRHQFYGAETVEIVVSVTA